jgi:HK97 family phage major capsid protein
MSKLKEMQEKRSRLSAEMKSMLKTAERRRSGLNAQEQETWDRLFNEATNLKNQIDTEMRLSSVENDLDKTRRGYNDPDTQYRHAMRTLLVQGPSCLNAEESRAIIAANDTQGGFLLAPEEWSASLVAAVTNLTRVRQLATKYKLQFAASFVGPTVETDVDDADWTPELGTIKEDASFKAGRRQFTPHLLTKAVIVSEKLLRASEGLAENIVIDRLSYKVGVSEEKGFLTGSGAMQPLGVFTTSDQGIPSTRDIVAPIDAAGITATGSSVYLNLIDALKAAKYSMKAQYWPRMEWFIHRNILKVVSTLKDGAGQYLYHESEDPSIPDTLLGRPINLSEYAPSTIESGKYVAVLGDFTTGYAICDLQEMEIKILHELYAQNRQVGIIIRRYTDGMPTLAEAFARVQVQ